MRTPAKFARIRAVQEGHEFGELSVRIIVGSDPVRGTAILPTGEHSEFWGWLELAEIVQSATKPETGGTVAHTGTGAHRGREAQDGGP